MNLRICDNAIYWFHRVLVKMGKIRASSLGEIQRDGFQRVLVVATTAIGDAVLCTPLIDSLRAAQPKAKIGFLVSAAAVSLFEGYSRLNAVLPYYGKYRRVKQTMKLLREERYDLALVANANDPDVIPMIWWSGCKRILRRPQRHTIYSFMVANPEMLSRLHTSGHAIERNLQFCDLLKIARGKSRMSLEIQEDARKRAEEMMKGCAMPWWVIHPGASRPKKEWGIANYANLACRILDMQKGTLILTGSRKEKKTCHRVEFKIGLGHRVCNLGGKLGLAELAALFSKAQLLISGDTGPYHIAMAVGTPTVTLFAPWDIGSSPKINGPYFDQERHLVVETERMGDPIATISVEQVFKACELFFLKTSTNF